jgi:hypothetical protein
MLYGVTSPQINCLPDLSVLQRPPEANRSNLPSLFCFFVVLSKQTYLIEFYGAIS